MSSARFNSEIKALFQGTMARYPNQKLTADTQQAYLEDWRDLCGDVGLQRFTEGVKRARSYCNFFPHVSEIREMLPPPRMKSDAEFKAMMADLKRRKADGEKFFTLADVLIEFRQKVEAGEIKSLDARGQKALEDWAKALRNSEKAFAARMLAESDKKRPKSEFEAVAELAAQKEQLLKGKSAGER